MGLKLTDGPTARVENGAVGEDSRPSAPGGRSRRSPEHRQPADRQRDPLGSQDRRPLARSARALSQVEDRPFALLAMDETGRVGSDPRGTRQGPGRRVVPDRCDDRSRSSGRGRSAKKTGPQAIGRSRGGPTTKIHARVDALGNPVHLHLTEGQVHDVTQVQTLLAGVHHANVIADKGYDANSVVDLALSQGCTAVIPSRSCRKQPREFDRHLYKERCLVENFFQRIKCNRRVAMRFEKLAANFLAMVQLAAILVWLA
jgi:transposase